MTLIIYTSILVILLVSYYFTKKSGSDEDKEFIQCVEAGPSNETTAADLVKRSYYAKKTVKRGVNGEILDENRFSRLLVKGNCMSPRNIKNGDMVIVEKMTQDEDFSAILKENIILWLYIEDTKMHKIRIFEGWDNGELKTYYYKNGVKHPSSEHHKTTQIRGVVRYKL